GGRGDARPLPPLAPHPHRPGAADVGDRAAAIAPRRGAGLARRRRHGLVVLRGRPETEGLPGGPVRLGLRFPRRGRGRERAALLAGPRTGPLPPALLAAA